LIFEGEIDANEENLNPLSHMLTRAVGTGEPLSLVDNRVDPLQNKDCFLLCTDGLYNAVSDQYISLLMSDTPSADKTAERLINKALKNGGRDNITAIVIQT
jgi:protein phosphatase